LINGADATDGCKTLEYTIIISGYSNPPDTGITAEMTLTLRDNDDTPPETVVINLDSLEETHTLNAFPLTITVTSEVQADGSLQVKISVGDQGQGQADFIFDKSVLNASWTDGEDPDPNSVPEPATLLLTGVGLGVAGLRRRFKTS
jgi:hypothetical protein